MQIRNIRQFLVGMGGEENQNKVEGEEREREQVLVEKGIDFIGGEDTLMVQGDIYQQKEGIDIREINSYFRKGVDISGKVGKCQCGKDICQFVKLFIVFLVRCYLVRLECYVDLFENFFQVEVKI